MLFAFSYKVELLDIITVFKGLLPIIASTLRGIIIANILVNSESGLQQCIDLSFLTIYESFC